MKYYYIEFIKKNKENVNTFHLVTVIFNNYKRALYEFEKICTIYQKKTMLSCCNTLTGCVATISIFNPK